MKKISVSQSGVFTIKEYQMEKVPEAADVMIRRLQAGPGEIREVISYVFEGEDPLGMDARSFSVEDFLEICPQLGVYGQGLSFDVIMLVDGAPVTVELTNMSKIVSINSLDRFIEISDLLND